MRMDNWKVWLADVDDDYLAGIANKGIVKRAYKDKEEGKYQVLSIGEEAKVSVGEETVCVRYPFGESKCSCPSRSVCRHIALGILVLKEQAENPKDRSDKGAKGPSGGRAKEEAESVAVGQKQIPLESESGSPTEKQRESRPEGQMAGQPGSGLDRQSETESESCQTGQPEKEESKAPEKLLKEIAAYPLESIHRVLGSRRLQGINAQIKAGQRPKIGYSSILTVELSKMGQTVKLLSPLEYSACTCRKKDFCIHKAAAVLWCKWEAGLLTKEELGEEAEQKPEYDIQQVREAAGQMKAFLEELLDTGLARVSPDVLDYLERLAIMSHNARLARFEGYWRALFDSYGNYLKRKTSFRVRGLMAQLSRLYRRVELLQQAEDDRAVAELAGEFRAEYGMVGELDLTGIAIEHFENQAGYEGETVYFLEEKTKEWYTYTYARPMFYEKKGGRRRAEKSQAPWGIPLSLEELAQARIHLDGAKCDGRGRLSASQETRGELTGDRKGGNRLTAKALEGWYYQDFGKLYQEQIGGKRKPWLKSQEDMPERMELVFLRPKSCEKAFFSETAQKLFMKLFDSVGREVVIEVAYSKRESWGIRYLERLREDKLPCFLGKVYARDGRIRMYPVAAFEKGELEEDGGME